MSKPLGSIEKYTYFSPPHLFIVQGRQRNLLKLLRRFGIASLQGYRILEIGCGRGNILLEYLAYGASPHFLYGMDINFDVLKTSHARLPDLHLVCANGTNLPYEDNTFDIVLQYTVFSSIFDYPQKEKLASEIMRILCKPNGIVIWYDFWINPVNTNTRGIGLREIRRLFDNCTFDVVSVTLAPPLVRRIVPISWSLAMLLERLLILNTHYLIAIHPNNKGAT